KAPDRNPFLADFLATRRLIARHGMLNSLAQVVVKLASPGVPDFYQGNELWDLSLVDPDNRRPVDYGRRAAILDELQAAFARSEDAPVALARELLASIEDGRIKLYVTWRGLALRARHPELFRE